jgi:hypothetical protein
VAEAAPVVADVGAVVVGSTPHIIGEVRADVGAEMDNGVAANDGGLVLLEE